MKLDISDGDLTEVYEFFQTLLGGEDINVDIQEKEIKVLMRKALKDYIEQINNWFITNNFSNVMGFNSSQNFTRRFITENTMIAQRMSDWWASMARVGGKTPWQKDYFSLRDNQQIYNLAEESSVPYTPGARRIHRIMWVAKPELMGGQFNPQLIDGGLVTFGQNGLMYGPNLMSYLGTVFDVVLLAQSLETRNKVLRSEFFYNISGDIVELTPMPGGGYSDTVNGTKVFYYYYNEEDLLTQGIDPDATLIGNPTQVGLDIINWSEVNQPGQNWIENWAIALGKYTVGSKLRQIKKIASGESEYQIEFDYQSLIDESKTEREALLLKLKEHLEGLNMYKMMENKASIAENSAKINKYSPRKPFFG